MNLQEKIDKYLNERRLTTEDKFIDRTATSLAGEIETIIENFIDKNNWFEKAEKEYGGELNLNVSDYAKLINLAIKRTNIKSIIKNVLP